MPSINNIQREDVVMETSNLCLIIHHNLARIDASKGKNSNCEAHLESELLASSHSRAVRV